MKAPNNIPKEGDIEVRNLQAEARQWEKKYKRTVALCKAILEEFESIQWIKEGVRE